MHFSPLEHFVIGELFAFLLIFVRIGAGIMILPGFGEAYVAIRARLMIALTISLVLLPLVKSNMPDIPASPFALAVIIMGETLIGLMFGFLARVVISALHVAGTIIAVQSSLSIATIFDQSMGGQSTILTNFLTLTAVVLFFTMDIHHIMIQGLVESYRLFSPGSFPVVEDIGELGSRAMSRAFAIAIQLSSPHIIFSLLFYMLAGIMSRLMPTFQVFFVLMPPQIMLSLFLLLAVFTPLMVYYTDYAQEALQGIYGEEP